MATVTTTRTVVTTVKQQTPRKVPVKQIGLAVAAVALVAVGRASTKQ